jgi:ArsR family transcriptional regulator
MDLIAIYHCFCDRTRLRMLNLLSQGPLCVCHLESVLGESQVNVSKHLGYLKAHGLVDVKRVGNWRVYSLPRKPSARLKANLACLQDCTQEDRVFRRDRQRLTKLMHSLGDGSPLCCVKVQPVGLPSSKASLRESRPAAVPAPANERARKWSIDSAGVNRNEWHG